MKRERSFAVLSTVYAQTQAQAHVAMTTLEVTELWLIEFRTMNMKQKVLNG